MHTGELPEGQQNVEQTSWRVPGCLQKGISERNGHGGRDSRNASTAPEPGTGQTDQ